MTTDRELMRRTWEFFSRYILVNEMAQESLDAEAKTILEALRARLAPPEREWQGLTQEDKREIIDETEPEDRGYVMALVEAKLKDKNA